MPFRDMQQASQRGSCHQGLGKRPPAFSALSTASSTIHSIAGDLDRRAAELE